jgi:hypothetical protein
VDFLKAFRDATLSVKVFYGSFMQLRAWEII